MQKRPLFSEEANKLLRDGINLRQYLRNNTEWKTITPAEHSEESHLEKWQAEGRPHLLMPLFVVDERYACFLDVAYGADIVVDTVTKEVEWNRNGVFTEDYCFLSDYYGFPQGAFYKRV